VDNAYAVALQTSKLLAGKLRTSGVGQMRWCSSGECSHLVRVANYWLGQTE
jgi:hypothetical protein